MYRTRSRITNLSFGDKYAILEKLKDGVMIGRDTRVRLVESDGMRFSEYGENYPTIGVFPIRTGRGLIAPVWDRYGLHDELTDLFNEEEQDAYGDTEMVLKEFLEGRGFFCEEIDLHGYSQSEWATVIVYDDSPIYMDKMEFIRQVWRGDLFDLIEEDRKTFTASDGEKIERWDYADYLFAYLPEDSAWDGVLDTCSRRLADYYGFDQVFGQNSVRGRIHVAPEIAFELRTMPNMSTDLVVSGFGDRIIRGIDTRTDGLALLMLHGDPEFLKGIRDA